MVGAKNPTGPDPVGLMCQGLLDAVQSNGVSGSGVGTIISAPEDFDAAASRVHGPDLLAEDPANVGSTYKGIYGERRWLQYLWLELSSGGGPIRKPRNRCLCALSRC